MKFFFVTSLFMKVDLTIVSGKTPDSSPSILLTIDAETYLFGLPVELSRTVIKGFKILRVKQFFALSASQDQMGGFNTCVTQYFIPNGKNMMLTAPKDAKKCLYLNLKGILDLDSLFSYEFSDENITVKPIELSNSVAFDVSIKDAPGSFDIEKAKKLNIPKGPLFRKLTQGESVALDDGKVINPSDVIGNPKKIDKILFIDADSVDDVDRIHDISQYGIVVHFTSIDLINDKKYSDKFTNVKTNICFPMSYIQVYPESIEYFNAVKPDFMKNITVSQSEKVEIKNFVEMHQNDSIKIYPEFKVNHKEIDNKMKEQIEAEDLPTTKTFAVTFLGSGAKYPTAQRNVQSILVHCKEGYILLDCGMNSVGQMRRLFGVEKTKTILKNLFALWISHSHSDHMLGIGQLITERRKVTENRIAILCDHIVARGFKPKENLFGEDYFKVDVFPREEVFKYKSVELRSVKVKHDITSMSCELTFDGKYKLVLSSDRNAAFNEIEESFKTTDVLIHEATFKDYTAEEEDDPGDRRHSTFSQALESGKKLQAKYILLNHCSQRYKNSDFCLPNESNAMFVYDYMTINYDSIENDFPIIKELAEKYNSSH